MGCNASEDRGRSSRRRRKRARRERRAVPQAVDDFDSVGHSSFYSMAEEPVAVRKNDLRYYNILEHEDPPLFKIGKSLMLLNASKDLEGIELGGYVREVDREP